MELYSGQINKLIDELAALPGIGSKSAQRLAFHLINMPKDRVDRLANVMIEARANVRYCKECYTLTDSIVLNDNTTSDDIEDWDSFEHINLVVAVEEEFSFKIPMGKVVTMKNVGEMVDIILELGKL